VTHPVVICGAGISTNARLPDGQGLARLVLEELWSRSANLGGRWPQQLTAALEWQDDRQPLLQLEMVLELLGRHIDPRTLVRVFTVLRSAQPTDEHLILASYKGDVVTTNQDLLIEQAAQLLGRSKDVLHLHGDWRHPAGIMALISQYVIGLKHRVRDELKSLVRGRELLVVGYSGRDRDVMPHLASATHVRWRHYARPGAVQQPLSEELCALMQAQPDLVTVELTDDPLEPITRRTHHRPPPPTPVTLELDTTTRRAFDALDRKAIDLGLVRVLERAGAIRAARRTLRKLAADPGDHAGAVSQRLGALHTGRAPATARRHYDDAVANAASPEDLAAAHIALAALHSNRSDYPGAEAALGHALDAAKSMRGRQRDRAVGRVLARSARMHVMTDQEGLSMREYRRVLAASRRAGDIDTLVEALVFGSDPWRSRGRYHEAMAMLDEARGDAELYARPGLSAWLAFYRGNTLGAMYRLDEAQVELHRAQASEDHQLRAWSLLLSGSYHRGDDRERARSVLKQAERWAKRLGESLFAFEARLRFERAELLRAARQWRRCERAMDDLAAALVSRPKQRMPYLEAHLAALRAELARDRDDPETLSLIATAQGLYQAGHWEHGVARMRVSRWLVHGGPPPTTLVQLCQARQFGLESEVLCQGHADRSLPLLLV
jgi:tetratricopeptide (TPR) repeat protein